MVGFPAVKPRDRKVEDLLVNVALTHESKRLKGLNCLVDGPGIQDRREIVSFGLRLDNSPVELDVDDERQRQGPSIYIGSRHVLPTVVVDHQKPSAEVLCCQFVLVVEPLVDGLSLRLAL